MFFVVAVEVIGALLSCFGYISGRKCNCKTYGFSYFLHQFFVKSFVFHFIL